MEKLQPPKQVFYLPSFGQIKDEINAFSLPDNISIGEIKEEKGENTYTIIFTQANTAGRLESLELYTSSMSALAMQINRLGIKGSLSHKSVDNSLSFTFEVNYRLNKDAGLLDVLNAGYQFLKNIKVANPGKNEGKAEKAERLNYSQYCEKIVKDLTQKTLVIFGESAKVSCNEDETSDGTDKTFDLKVTGIEGVDDTQAKMMEQYFNRSVPTSKKLMFFRSDQFYAVKFSIPKRLRDWL